jgi:CheY-like chemotaxis protein
MSFVMDFIADNQSGIDQIPQLRILVVDDDGLNQRMMQLLLMREGHLVDLASSGLEALNAVKLQWYDIVFMDLQMPVMDGIEASRRIREWENGGQHTFIVALTASYLPEKGHILFEAGIDNYVSKPFEIEHIHQLLKYSFRSRLAVDSGQAIILKQEAPSEKVLDIEKGIVQVGGDENMYRELLADFIQGLPVRLQSIQRYFEKRDLVELSRAAHNLGGIAANLGAAQLSVCARKLDKQSVEGYTESIDPLVQEIQLGVRKLLETSSNFLAEKKISVPSA